MEEENKQNLVTLDLDKFMQYAKENMYGVTKYGRYYNEFTVEVLDYEDIPHLIELATVSHTSTMKINLELAPKIVKALERRQLIDGKPYCPCKPGIKDDSIVCPCVDMRVNNKCCCGLFVEGE